MTLEMGKHIVEVVSTRALATMHSALTTFHFLDNSFYVLSKFELSQQYSDKAVFVRGPNK